MHINLVNIYMEHVIGLSTYICRITDIWLVIVFDIEMKGYPTKYNIFTHAPQTFSVVNIAIVSFDLKLKLDYRFWAGYPVLFCYFL